MPADIDTHDCDPHRIGAISRSAWFAVQAKPNAAHIAARNLARQGFGVFLPLERHTLRRGRSLVTSIRPYFSGYLFASFDPDTAPWRVIRSTYGVSRLVSFGAGPIEVDPELVSCLMDLCDEHGVVRERLHAQRGDAIRIAEGPLAGIIGTLEAMAPQERAWLLIDVMGKSTRVCVPTSGLRRAS
jgi:transcriptional antiterminator RfaH